MAGLKEKRNEVLLGALLVAIAFVVWHNLVGDQPGGSSSGGRRGAGARTDLSGLRIFPVQWASLSAPRPAYDPSGRNIFQFGVIPVPPPPPLTPAEKEAIEKARQQAEAERLRAEELARQQAEQQQKIEIQRQQELANQPPPPPPKPQPPPVNFKFIGYIGPPDHKIAVLHDGKDLVFAKQGDEVSKGITILEIGYESIKFGFTDPQFKGESQTLPMSSSY
ncbi:MAG TPA: hypothetical protein VFT43_00695 [Candidatus Polarisedimenticolia bacterium]|nr:hypothetical protein [Candidatus Polarisedimenticolia bacterium]